jgi:hypothetical protein
MCKLHNKRLKRKGDLSQILTIDFPSRPVGQDWVICLKPILFPKTKEIEFPGSTKTYSHLSSGAREESHSPNPWDIEQPNQSGL